MTSGANSHLDSKRFGLSKGKSTACSMEQLKKIASNDQDIDSTEFRDILRLSAQYGLIENIDDWLDYRKMRNITSHTYDENKAQQVYNGIANFLESSRFLLQQLKIRNPHD